jgi:hypothetical protein
MWWWLQVSLVSLLFRLGALVRCATCMTRPGPAGSICFLLLQRYWTVTAWSEVFFICGGASQTHDVYCVTMYDEETLNPVQT